MAKSKQPPKSKKEVAPDDLVRQAAGSYRTGDGRFEVQQSQSTWFLLDTEETNELGQELIHGPFASLKQVREAIPGARNVTALPRTQPAPRRERKPKRPPPPTWIDRLPDERASEVRRLIRALEEQGVTDAEAVVRRDVQADLPAVAARLIEVRLAAIVDEVAGSGPARAQAEELLRRVGEILSLEGSTVRPPLPGWVLVETGGEPDPPNRRIRLGG